MINPSVTVLGHGTLVNLCVPTLRQSGVSLPVGDAFGGPTWQPFIRRLTALAAQTPRLAKWLGAVEAAAPGLASSDDNSALPTADAAVRDAIRLVQARSPIGSAASQHRQDLLDVAHRLIDGLMARAPRLNDVATAPPAAYLSEAAVMFGFEAGDPTTARVRSSQAPAADRSLLDRMLELLVLFAPTEPGPLHVVAQIAPNLLRIADRIEADAGNVGMRALLLIVQALAGGLESSSAGAAPAPRQGVNVA